MNKVLIHELIKYHSSQAKAIALSWDSQRQTAFWASGRYDVPISLPIFREVIIALGLQNSRQSIGKEGNWILLNFETEEVSIVPWKDADSTLQQQYKDNPDLEIQSEFNAPSIALEIAKDWVPNLYRV